MITVLTPRRALYVGSLGALTPHSGWGLMRGARFPLTSALGSLRRGSTNVSRTQGVIAACTLNQKKLPHVVVAVSSGGAVMLPTLSLLFCLPLFPNKAE